MVISSVKLRYNTVEDVICDDAMLYGMNTVGSDNCDNEMAVTGYMYIFSSLFNYFGKYSSQMVLLSVCKKSGVITIDTKEKYPDCPTVIELCEASVKAYYICEKKNSTLPSHRECN